jgi:two-component system cell cycle response regulator
MALRVLLADESTTIKKVMQLALQDFAIEVKAVHVGVDVLEVARTFQPDIVFADILLQKKNGYEVCHDLKNDSKLKGIPVVLMWSSFMEFDEALAVKNKAEGRLEKPFDVEVLRKLILELVPKTRTQRLAHFLEFSDKVTEPLKSEIADHQPSEQTKTSPARESTQTFSMAPPPPPPPPLPKREEPAPSTWNMDSFEDVDLDKDHFTSLNLSGSEKQKPAAGSTTAANDDQEPWSHQDLSRFKIDLPPVSIETDDLDLKIDLGEEEFTTPDFSSKRPTPPEPTTAITYPTAKIDRSKLPDDTLSLDQPKIPVFDEPIEEITFGLEDDEEVQAPEAPTPIAPLEFDSLSLDETTLATPKPGTSIPQMDADRLEEIIRAQSRDIIEAVVRKIVPDLAETIIRNELERLLGDERPRST